MPEDSDDNDDHDVYGVVAQLVARSVVCRKVAGSSPVYSAQRGVGLVGLGRLPVTQEDTGSNPVHPESFMGN